MSAAPTRSFRFGRENKLHETDEFSSVFRFRCTQRGTILDVLARPNRMQHPRLGMVVARKILRRAVDRNRLRRILREIFRHAQHDMPALDIVVRLKRAASEDDLKEEFGRLLLACRSCANTSVSNTK